MFNNNERDKMAMHEMKMYRGQLELPATIKEDKKQRADLIETLAKAINILRDGNDIDFALEFIKRHVKGIR
jgi:hypothetical protein